jgi:hypothetical protein
MVGGPEVFISEYTRFPVLPKARAAVSTGRVPVHKALGTYCSYPLITNLALNLIEPSELGFVFGQQTIAPPAELWSPCLATSAVCTKGLEISDAHGGVQC